MCQMSVILECEGRQQKIMDNVTLLEVTPQGVTVSTFFEEPITVAAAVVSRVDMNTGLITLSSVAKGVAATGRAEE